MRSNRMKFLLAAAFSVFFSIFSTFAIAQNNGHEQVAEGPQPVHESETEETKGVDAGGILMGHILDAHEYHFADINGHPVTLPLPVILYSPQKGFSFFMSSKLEHGHTVYNGYQIIDNKIVAVKEAGVADESIQVYDLSITRNVAQMLVSMIILIWLFISIANSYKKRGIHSAPKGMQNALEPVITFIRDEVGKVNLGHKYEKYMPYLLTVFFFILINALMGLLPGSANVTGNIAFTLVLGVISLLVIIFSTNTHFWGHIFWPPGVPFLVKLILIPVELLGVFIKPAALIIRLFANMVGGHMIITCLLLMIFIFASINTFAGIGFSPVSIAFTVFIYLIELLVAFIQAFIFTNLTAVFIGQAFEGEHHDDEHQADLGIQHPNPVIV